MENIKKQYEAETGESWENSQGEPDIDYVEWLENKINAYETLGVFPRKKTLNTDSNSNSAPSEYDPLEDSDDPRTMNLNNG